MKGSIRLFKLSGIPLFIHSTFFLLPIGFAFFYYFKGSSWFQIFASVLFILLVYVCVTLHELGHALMARKFGVNTVDITLLPIGGVARLEKIPEKPLHEFLVAIAGPAVNVLIFLIILLALFGFNDLEILFKEFLKIPDEKTIYHGNFWFFLMVTNIGLVLFNAIPAFPMDGGRVLRAFLASITNYNKATQIASIIGQIIAIGFIGFAIYEGEIILTIIGVFIFFNARMEAKMVQNSHGETLKKYLITNNTYLFENEPIRNAIGIFDYGIEQNFIVLNSSKEVIGILRKEVLENKYIRASAQDLKIGEMSQKSWQAIQFQQKIRSVKSIMETNNYAILPVFYQGNLIGIVKLEDLL